jgi:hypothetical protein
MGCNTMLPVEFLSKTRKITQIIQQFNETMQSRKLFLHPTPSILSDPDFLYKHDLIQSKNVIVLNQQEVNWLLGLLRESRIEIHNNCNDFYLDQSILCKFGLKNFLDKLIRELS